MKKNTHTLRGGALRTAMALALAVGLMPAQALSNIAVAAEAGSETSSAAQQAPAAQPDTIVTETVKLEGGASEGANAPAEDAAAPAAGSAQQTATAPVAASAANSAAASASGADGSVDIVSASIKLEAEAEATLVSYGGLSFALDEAARTAALVGIASSALEGELTIPAEISTSAGTYKVTAVNSSGGGGNRL